MAEAGKNLKIVYTPIHGSGNVPVRRILREIGITNVSVVKEQERPTQFSTVKVPNPEDPAAFTLAIKLANEVARTPSSAPTRTATVWAWRCARRTAASAC